MWPFTTKLIKNDKILETYKNKNEKKKDIENRCDFFDDSNIYKNALIEIVIK